MLSKPPYKDSNGRFITQSLFYETKSPGAEAGPFFTLKDYDHTVDGVVYPSMKNLYIDMCDPTEYEFAIKYLGSWDHWQRLCSAGWFIPIVREWRDEVEVKVRCIGVKEMLKRKSSPDAAKWLAEGKFVKDTRTGKDKKIRQQKIANDMRSTLDDDARRLGITTNSGEDQPS